MTEDEVKDVFEQHERLKALRAALLPDEQACLSLINEACRRLDDLGWKWGATHPKREGDTFQAIQITNFGAHLDRDVVIMGKGHAFTLEAGDAWPVKPVLWKEK